jgi:branched-chain amino acid transport system permease protein
MLQYITSGFQQGCIYALVALGIVIVYRASRVLNFAHGDISTFGTFVCYSFIVLGLPFPTALLFGVTASALTGMFFFLAVLHPAQKREVGVLGQVVLTLGFALLLQGIEAVIWGTDIKSMPFPLSEQKLYNFFGIRISQLGIGILALCFSLVFILYLFVQKMRLGLAMRAVSQNMDAAKMLGIPTRSILAMSWGIASALGASAGIFLAPSIFLDPYFMLEPFLKGFAAAVLGGLDSLPGAILAGIILGISESLFGGYISLKFKSAFAFIIIILVLILRPEGILGREIKERV